jgi:type 2 lantibiotic biosynthesis protein LanM
LTQELPITQNSTTFLRLDPSEFDWAVAIAKGAPPFERLRHPAYRIISGDQADDEAAQRWLNTVSAGSSRCKENLLKTLEYDEASVKEAFRPAYIDADERLPEWIECLIQTIRAMPETARNLVAHNPPVASSGVLINPALQLLNWQTLRAQYPFIANELIVPLTNQLATRILLACGATLELENLTNTQPIWDLSRQAWMDRLCGFSSLNFVIGTTIRQWRRNALETLTRTGRDLPLLNRTLLNNSGESLVNIEGDLGDRHNDGRSVSVLTFSSGKRVVYKPKDLRCAYQFLKLSEYLNDASGSIAFSTRRILCRGQYAWEEYVEERTADTEREAAIYFRRFGAVLRLIQLVEGRDFWLDNLRISGDMPVFIDLECILHPRLKSTNSGGKIADMDPELYEESVLPTAAITHPIDIPGAGVQDFGALSCPGPRQLPLGAWSGYRDQRSGNFWLHQGRIYWEPQLSWPHLKGEPAEPIDYINEVEDGYREIHDLLCRDAPGLLGPKSPLKDFSNVPVRVLMRTTWEYLVLLRASLEPTALLDGNARELALAHVFATAPEWDQSEDNTSRFAIARCELNAIRNLDIPEFYSFPSSTLVFDTSQCPLADIFEGYAQDRLNRRLAEIDSFDIESQTGILRRGITSIKQPAVRLPTHLQ